MNDAPDTSDSILKQTIRYVLGLTAACVVFVSLASALSLFLVHRALDERPSSDTQDVPALKKSSPTPLPRPASGDTRQPI
jgi:hypothetical protein